MEPLTVHGGSSGGDQSGGPLNMHGGRGRGIRHGASDGAWG